MHTYFTLAEDGVTVIPHHTYPILGEDRRVAETLLSDEVWISTVFLCLDHSYNGDLPLVFETMVFFKGSDAGMWRYSTWEQALRGHWSVVTKLRRQRLQGKKEWWLVEE